MYSTLGRYCSCVQVLLYVVQFVEVEAVVSCTNTAAWFISAVARYCTCVVGSLLFNADICDRSPTRIHCNASYQAAVCIQHTVVKLELRNPRGQNFVGG